MTFFLTPILKEMKVQSDFFAVLYWWVILMFMSWETACQNMEWNETINDQTHLSMYLPFVNVMEHILWKELKEIMIGLFNTPPPPHTHREIVLGLGGYLAIGAFLCVGAGKPVSVPFLIRRRKCLFTFDWVGLALTRTHLNKLFQHPVSSSLSERE